MKNVLQWCYEITFILFWIPGYTIWYHLRFCFFRIWCCSKSEFAYKKR